MPKKIKWVLVADGERAKFLVQQDGSLSPVYPTHHATEDITIHKDKGVGKPGQALNTTSQAFGAYPSHTDWHRFQKDTFAVEIAHMLNKEVDNFKDLVVIAPPVVLGDLRKHFSDHVQNKIVHEVNKDLTKAPLDDLMKYVVPPYQ